MTEEQNCDSLDKHFNELNSSQKELLFVYKSIRPKKNPPLN
jgi:hypothetical protein